MPGGADAGGSQRIASSMLALSLSTLNQISADAPPRMAIRMSAGRGRYFRYGRVVPPEIPDRTGPLPSTRSPLPTQSVCVLRLGVTAIDRWFDRDVSPA